MEGGRWLEASGGEGGEGGIDREDGIGRSKPLQSGLYGSEVPHPGGSCLTFEVEPVRVSRAWLVGGTPLLMVLCL